MKPFIVFLLRSFHVDNHVQIASEPMQSTNIGDMLNHVFIINDNGVYDDYSVLDVLSIFLQVFIHPEEYPPVHHFSHHQS